MKRLLRALRLMLTQPAVAWRLAISRLSVATSSFASGLIAQVLATPMGREAVWKAMHRDANWTPQPNVAIAAEIQRRIRQIPDPEGSNRYLPHRWRMIFNEIRAATAGKVDWSADPVCLNFGAGDRNPAALSLLFGLAGASTSYVLEPGAIRRDIATATLQETLWDVVCAPESYGLSLGSVARLPQLLNSQALFHGKALDDVLDQPAIRLLRDVGERLSIPPQSLDFVYSRSVLEHVMRIEDAMTQLVKALKIGGFMFHDIGLSAHDTVSPITFYYKERGIADNPLADLNGWRKSDFVALFESLGCSVQIGDEEKVPVEAIDRNSLVPRFQKYCDDDLRTVQSKMLVTRIR